MAVTAIPARSVTTTLQATLFMQPDTVDVRTPSQRITISFKQQLKRIVFAIGKK